MRPERRETLDFAISLTRPYHLIATRPWWKWTVAQARPLSPPPVSDEVMKSLNPPPTSLPPYQLPQGSAVAFPCSSENQASLSVTSRETNISLMEVLGFFVLWRIPENAAVCLPMLVPLSSQENTGLNAPCKWERADSPLLASPTRSSIPYQKHKCVKMGYKIHQRDTSHSPECCQPFTP